MTSSIASVDFHGNSLMTIRDDNGTVFVAMKPIVDGLGLSWGSQWTKLRQNKGKYGCFDIKTPSNGGEQTTVCIPLTKLNAWLFSVNPEKVRKDIRPNIIRYQEECAFVLYEYWHKGQAVNPRAAISSPSPEAVPAARPIKPRFIPITKQVLRADVITGVKAYAAAYDVNPKFEYRRFFSLAKGDANVPAWEYVTDEKACKALLYTRRRFDYFLESVKAEPIKWRPISSDGKSVMTASSMRKAAAALSAPAPTIPATALATMPDLPVPAAADVIDTDQLSQAARSRAVIDAQLAALDKLYYAVDDYLYAAKRVISAEVDKLTKGAPASERMGRKAIASEIKTGFGTHTHAMLASVNAIRSVLRVTATAAGMILPAKGRAKPTRAKTALRAMPDTQALTA